MYTDHNKKSICSHRLNTKPYPIPSDANPKNNDKKRKKPFCLDTTINYHGLNNKNFLRVLPCLCFAFAIMLSLLIVASYTKHHSYYLQEDASITTTKFAAKNDIFNESDNSFEVSVILADTTITVPTGKTTVSQLLADLNIDMTLREADVPIDTIIANTSSIYIYDVEYQETTRTESIPYETEIVEVSTIPYGTTRVMTEGREGLLVQTIKEKLVDGKVTGETVTSNKRTEPVTEIIYKGVGGYFTGEDGVTYHYSYYIDVEATAYTAPASAHTASGPQVSTSVIAVDPRVISLGTKVYVASDYYDCGVRYALDTGSAIKGNIIDVFMGTDSDAYRQAVQWGRRSARVYILVDD